MKKIPKKNYIMLLVIIILTLLLAIYLRNLYLNQVKKENSIQIEHVYEIDEKSLRNYIVENDSFILYIADREEENLNDFEKKLGNYLTKKEYTKNIIYLNLDDVSETFYKNIKKEYFSKKLKDKSFSKQTNLLYFENKKVVDILYSKQSKIEEEHFKNFIENHNNMERES